MIDYRAEKEELIRRGGGNCVHIAWFQGANHMHLFDNLGYNRTGCLVDCGCATQVKADLTNNAYGLRLYTKNAPVELHGLMEEIKNDPLIPAFAYAMEKLTLEELPAVLDRFIYYQEAADRLLGRSLDDVDND
jgi:hypothetical protein